MKHAKKPRLGQAIHMTESTCRGATDLAERNRHLLCNPAATLHAVSEERNTFGVLVPGHWAAWFEWECTPAEFDAASEIMRTLGIRV